MKRTKSTREISDAAVSIASQGICPHFPPLFYRPFSNLDVDEHEMIKYSPDSFINVENIVRDDMLGTSIDKEASLAVGRV